MTSRVLESFRRIAAVVAAWSIGIVFALFVAGVAMRYLLNRPQSWIDEMVTLLTVWSTFWTAAFVLKWPEHIAFDIVYAHVSAGMQRLFLLVGLVGFCALMLAAMPGMIDYTMFLWRERTDSMQLRLDWVYAVFPLFFAVIIVRMLFAIRKLASRDWRHETARWSSGQSETQS